jgi:hypothetical protein
MKLVSKWAFLVLFLAVSLPLAAQTPQSVSSGNLFVRTLAPASVSTPFPADAGFFRVSHTVFSALRTKGSDISWIEQFPLGSKLVTLNVERFDALTDDAAIVIAGIDGNHEFAAPKHIMLRGDVDEYPGSHVFLAVFSNYVTGYIEVPDGLGSSYRYLVQPVSLSGEGDPSMIVYKENDIDRSNQQKHTWNCGTEGLSSNKESIKRIESQMASRSLDDIVAEPQAKSIRLLRIDVEGDNEYLADHKGDTVKAINYALATVAAVSDIYIRDLSAALQIQKLRIWVKPDPFTYTSSDPTTAIDEMLQSLDNFAPSDLPNDKRAGCILLSGLNAIGGLAHLNTLCPDPSADWSHCVCGTENNVNFPQDGYVWDVNVVAHEFGHLVGSLHTHSCTWAPPIDSCVEAEEGNCYSTPVPVKGTLMSYCHLTPKGVDLKFHTRNIPLLKQNILAAGCGANFPLPIAKAGGDQYRCGSDSVTLKATVQDGTAPYNYSWRLSSTKIVYATTATIKVRPVATSAKYILTVTDSKNLRTYDTVTITLDNMKANAGANISTCDVKSVALTGTVTNAVGKTTYQWLDSSNGTVIGTTASITAPMSGTAKTFGFRVTDSVGCVSTDYMSVTIKPAPAKPVITALGDTLEASTASTYQWYRNDTLIPNATSRRYVPKASGSFTVVITGGGGCSSISDALSFTAGVSEELSRFVTIRPNPATDKLIVEWMGESEPLHSIYITDLVGNTVLSVGQQSSQSFPIDIRELVSGTYFLHYTIGNSEAIKKFVKQ